MSTFDVDACFDAAVKAVREGGDVCIFKKLGLFT